MDNVFMPSAFRQGVLPQARRWGAPFSPAHVGLFLLAFLVIVFREKSYFLSPRFWAEEGAVFFSFARHHEVLDTLFRPHLGYYSLFANLASILAARLVPLEVAPLVTTMLALAVQCLPVVIVIFGRSQYWHGFVDKIIVLIIIFLAPLSYEVWLNTVNSQFYLCLFTALLLFEPPSEGGGKVAVWLLRFGLATAGLTGVLSCLLVPLYWLRVWAERQREIVTWALILSVCMLFQLAVVANSRSMEVDSRIIADMGVILPARAVHADLPALGSALLVKTLLLNFLGPLASEPLIRALHDWHGRGGLGAQAVGYGGLALLVCFHLWLARRLRPSIRYLLPGCFWLLVVPSTVFALVDDMRVLIGVHAAQRYFYVPNILALLMVYFAIDWGTVKRLSSVVDSVLAALLSMALVFGAMAFADFPGGQGTVYDPSWPKWRDEIVLWRKDNSHPVRIWPAPQWKVVLDTQ